MKIKVRQMYMQYDTPARYEIYNIKGKLSGIYYPDRAPSKFDALVKAARTLSQAQQAI